MMNIEPIAYFRSPLTSKFGIPRQSGIVTDLQGTIAFVPQLPSPKHCADSRPTTTCG